ncbi:CTP synthase, partial [Ananas comosus]
MKYVLVTGGVVSGLGKGVTASSIGVVLKACGLRVTSIKIDPYLNTDAGTMSPFEHGEVFVLDDGGEVDLDLGNYERFLDIKLTRDNNITTGKIYQSVITRRGRETIWENSQVVHTLQMLSRVDERVAHIPVDGKEGPPDSCKYAVQEHVLFAHNDSGMFDAGDIESMPFIEALGPGNFCLVQQSCSSFNVVSEQALDESVKENTSQFCHVPASNIVTLYDVTNIWRIPLLLRDQKAHEAILKVLNLRSDPRVSCKPMLDEWTDRATTCDELQDPVRIAMVGKYTGLSDSYLSVLKALLHASVVCRRKLVVDWVPSSDLEDATAEEAPDAYKTAWDLLKGADGILVPGGFGDRGVQGKMLAAKYA